MFRFACALLAKKKSSPPTRRKVLKRSSRSSSAASKARAAAAAEKKNRINAANGGEAGIVLTDGTSAAVDSEAALPRVAESTTKRPSYRLATAVATVVVPPSANELLEQMKQTLTPAIRRSQSSESETAGLPLPMEEYYTSKKGPLFATAVIAGTNAVKQASMLIPFCHPIPIQKCSFTFRRRVAATASRPSSLPHRVVLRKRNSPPSPRPSRQEYSILYCFCTVATDEYKAGVEMEALTGATMASITLYDMLKGLPGAQEDGLGLGESFVLAKRGGKNDFIKLLMSEPDKPSVQQGEKLPVLPSPEPRPNDDATSSGEARDPRDNRKERDAAMDRDGEEDDRHDRARVVKKSLSGGGGGNVPTPGDAGAWWRSSKHEKRMHEQFPRRKFVEERRVPDATLASASENMGTHAGGKDDQRAAEMHEDEEGAGEHAPVKSSRDGTKSKVPVRGGKKSQGGHSEEEDEEEVHPVPRKKGGQNMKKSGRAPPPEEEPEEDHEPSEEEEEPPERSRKKAVKKPAKAPAKGSKQQAREEESEEEEPEEEEQEEEVDDTPATRKKGSAVKKATPERRHRRGEESDEDSAHEEEEEPEEEDYQPRGGKKGGGKRPTSAMRTVAHDSWDNETEVSYDEEEEVPPPPPKKLKKKGRR